MTLKTDTNDSQLIPGITLKIQNIFIICKEIAFLPTKQ